MKPCELVNLLTKMFGDNLCWYRIPSKGSSVLWYSRSLYAVETGVYDFLSFNVEIFFSVYNLM